MAWNIVTLTTEQIEEQRALEKLEKQFEKLYIAADGPDDMALLSDNDYTDGKIGIYFTPGCNPLCKDVISQYGGEECDPPTIDHVFLLDGNDYALDLLKEE
jgi:hypothetical protein